MNRKKIALLALVAVLALSGCSGKIWKSRNETDDHKLTTFGQNTLDRRGEETGEWDSAADAGEESFFSFGDKEDGLFAGIGGGGRVSEDELRQRKLFAGALDAVLELPVQVANRDAGFISTDWKASPNDPRSRYRLNIRLSGVAPYGEVRVVVLKQAWVRSQWVDRPADKVMAKNIQKLIRLKSKKAKLK